MTGSQDPDELYSLKDGDVDAALGKTVDTLVIRSDGEYVVYLDQDCYIQWHVEPGYEPEEGWDGYHEMAGRLTHLEATAHEAFRPISVLGKTLTLGRDGANRRRLYFLMRQLADVQAVLLDPGDARCARGHLRRAARYLRDRQNEIARAWMLSTSMLGTLVVGLSALWSQSGSAQLGVVSLAAAGCLGSLLAVFHRLGGEAVDPSGNKGLLVLEALGRLAVGAVAAIAAVFAWRAGLLPALVSDTTAPEAEAVVAILFGTTGRLPKGLVERVDPQEQHVEDQEPEEPEEPEEPDRGGG